MTTVNVPKGASNRISGRDGRIYSTRVSEDRTVVDMMPQDFESLASTSSATSACLISHSFLP